MYGRASTADGDRLLADSGRPGATVGVVGGAGHGYGATFEHNRRLQAHPDRLQAFRVARVCPPVYTASGTWLDMMRIPTVTVTPAGGDALAIAAAEHVEKCLGIGRVSPIGMRWSDAYPELLDAVLDGFGLWEMVPVEVDGVFYTPIAHRDPASVSQWVVDERERLVAAEQMPIGGWTAGRSVIPMSQALHLVWRPLSGGADFSGTGALRPAEPLAGDYNRLCNLRMAAAQRWALDTPVSMPDIEARDRAGISPEQHKLDGDDLDRAMKNYASHERAHLRLPIGWKIDAFGAAPESLAAIDALIDSTSRRICEIWLQQWIMLGSAGAGGSYNLSEIQVEAARSSAQGVCDWLAGQLNSKYVPRAVRWQFGPDFPLDAMPRFGFTGLASKAFTRWLAHLPGMVQTGLLRIDDSLRDVVRQEGEIPAENPNDRPGPPVPVVTIPRQPAQEGATNAA